MIERNLRYLTVRKYGSAFLEAFGMLPLDYFGCVGDNQTDNYANLQVAIDESIKRGLTFIFVPNGTYLYSGSLLHTDKVKFIGNSDHAKIYDGEDEIPIYQIGCQMPYLLGIVSFTKTVPTGGKVDIPVPVKNPLEAILVINGSVFYVTDGLITVDGALLGDTSYLSEDVKITDIKLVNSCIQIYYTIETSPATIDTSIEWRVR